MPTHLIPTGTIVNTTMAPQNFLASLGRALHPCFHPIVCATSCAAPVVMTGTARKPFLDSIRETKCSSPSPLSQLLRHAPLVPRGCRKCSRKPVSILLQKEGLARHSKSARGEQS